MHSFKEMVELNMRINEYMKIHPTSYTKTKFSEIEELKEFEWPNIATDIKFGKIPLRIMGPAPMSFQVVASPAQKSSNKFFNILSVVSVILSIALSVTISWWFLLLIILFPVFRAAAKAAYNDAMLGSAITSEEGFSFLFSRGAICLQGKDGLIYTKVK
tara:strand:+ start:68 stop:544 length:477 start_codon:yes stop_codon:yes gene_type:complete